MTTFYTIKKAIQNDDIQKLSFLFDNYKIDSKSKQYFVRMASEQGKLDILKFLHEKVHCKLDYFCTCSATYNEHYHCLIDKKCDILEFFCFYDTHKWSISKILCIMLLEKENVSIFYGRDPKTTEPIFDSKKHFIIHFMKHAYNTIEKYILIKKQKKQTVSYKKELIENAFHPKRLFEWCQDTDELQKLHDEGLIR